MRFYDGARRIFWTADSASGIASLRENFAVASRKSFFSGTVEGTLAGPNDITEGASRGSAGIPEPFINRLRGGDQPKSDAATGNGGPEEVDIFAARSL